MISYYNQKDSEKLVVNFSFGGKEESYTIASCQLKGFGNVEKLTSYHSDIFRQKFTFKSKTDKSKIINHLVSSIKDYWLYVNEMK